VTETPGIPPQESGNTNSKILLSVYERAQDATYHTDLILWQIAAIVWSANAVLLGLVLQFYNGQSTPWLVLLVSAIGMVLTIFVARVCYVAKVVKGVGYPMCQEIEKQFVAELRLHTKIDEKYPKGMARNWVMGITALFVFSWLCIFIAALRPFLCRR